LCAKKTWKYFADDCQSSLLDAPDDEWLDFFPDGLLPFNHKYIRDGNFWKPFHGFAKVIEKETCRRGYGLSQGPPDTFVFTLMRACVKIKELTDADARLEEKSLKKQGFEFHTAKVYGLS
jgi:hypothetical protein